MLKYFSYLYYFQELEAEQKAPEFHANPLPSMATTKGVPKKKFMELTNVEPFHLKSDERGAIHQRILKEKVRS